MTAPATSHPIPDAALDEDIAILGRKGGGKSYTAKGIVERLLDMGRRVLVLDPLGVWAGLRTSADGEHDGYPVAIFGGLHGDLPLDPAAAEPLARVIAAENLPAVIDLSELSKSAQQAFLLKFLHELRRTNRDALTIVLEEADVFAPQNPQGDDSKALHGEIDWIARRGRFKGFRLLTITQRPARLSKDVLTQANMVIMHRLPAPQDRDAAKAWVDGNGDRDQAKVVFDTLAGLKVGEAWVLAQEPAMLERAMFPRIKTLDTSSTPKAGETRIEPKTLAQVDVSAIRAALAAVEPEGKKPAKNITQNITADLSAAEERGYQRGLAEGIERGKSIGASVMLSTVQTTIGHLRVPDVVEAHADEAIGASPAAASVPAPQPSPAARKAIQRSAAPQRDIELASSKVDVGEPGVAALAMLGTLVEAYPSGLPANLWGTFSGRSPVSGPWHKAVAQLKAANLILGDRNSFTATAAGIERAQTKPANIGSEVEIWAHWRETIAKQIGNAGLEMLSVLSDHRPNKLTGLQWGLLTGRSPVSGPWHGALASLTKWGCIEKSGTAYSVTDKGAVIAQRPGGADTVAALVAIRIGRLSSLAREIYHALPGERGELAKRLGKSPISGPWHAAIKEILASGLATEDDKIIRTKPEAMS